MSASELNEGQPVSDFLAPADAQTAPLSEPAEGPLHDPTARGKLRFARNRALFERRLSTFALTFDVRDVALLLDQLMNIFKVIALVGTKMLFGCRSLDHNRDDQVVSRPLVMRIGPGQHHCQRCATLVDQKMYFSAAFAVIRGVFARLFAAQRRRAALAVSRLPLPVDLALLDVELDHDAHDPLEDALLLPGLKSLVEGAAAHPKPIFVHGLPLAARPQHIPNPIHDRSVIGWRSSWTLFFRARGQRFPELAPQRARHLKVINFFRLLDRVFAHGASRIRWVGGTPILYEMRLFFHAPLNLWIDSK